MPTSSPRPRAPIWGTSWTVGIDAPANKTVLTLYDAVPFPRLDIRLSPAQVDQLIRDLRGTPPPPPSTHDDIEQEIEPMILKQSQQEEVSDSETLITATDLSPVLLPDRQFALSTFIHFIADDAAEGVRFAMNADPAGGFGLTAEYEAWDNEGNRTAGTFDGGDPVLLSGWADYFVRISGIVSTGSRQQLVRFQWAQKEAGPGQTKLLEGSFIRFDQVAN